MRILGISCYYHDAAAALIADGELVAAAEEERFSRLKHDHGFPGRAIEFCLAEAGIRGEDLDWVVFYEKPLVKFERILMSALARFPASAAVFREAMISWFNDKLWIKSTIRPRHPRRAASAADRGAGVRAAGRTDAPNRAAGCGQAAHARLSARAGAAS